MSHHTAIKPVPRRETSKQGCRADKLEVFFVILYIMVHVYIPTTVQELATSRDQGIRQIVKVVSFDGNILYVSLFFLHCVLTDMANRAVS